MMSDSTMARPASFMQSQVRTLAPMLLWMACIAAFSGEMGSQAAMRRIISWLSLHAGGDEVGATLNESVVWVMRKMLHLGEYGVLAMLALRWVESLPGGGRGGRGALLVAGGYATLDELHQTFVPVRTGSPWDVLIDIIGASIALGLVGEWRKERQHFASRLLDIAGATVGMVLGAPLLAVSSAAVWLTMGRPVFFRQVRTGLRERPFELVKLRSMTDRRGADGKLLPGTERLTRLGALLRHLSLDEIPQLWNVLKGEMSLVGPRPLYPSYLPYYTERERTRHLVRPGITGLAQVSGRNDLEWDERLELDARYVERKSLALDLWILVLTVIGVLARRGAGDEPVQGSLAEYRRERAQRRPER